MAGDPQTATEEPSEIKGRDESPIVVLTLSHSQVDHVLRRVGGEDSQTMPELLAAQDLHVSRARQMLLDRYRSLQDDRRLSRSLLAGLLVLSCFPPGGVELGIKDIAEQLELSPSTVHRYVATLHAAGLLARDSTTRRYRLAAD